MTPATPMHICPLGGLGEVGKNITLYECQGDMILVDCGLVFPDADMFGVDLVIPDFTYVLENKDRIKGLFITHGHYYYVSMGEDHLKEEARGRGADIVMYGHTHRPSITREKDLTVVNPGSIAYPRQEGRRGTYVLMETDENGKAEFALKYV